MIRKTEKTGTIVRAEKMFCEEAPDHSAEAIPAMHAFSGATETSETLARVAEEATPDHAPDIPADGLSFPKEILAAEDASTAEDFPAETIAVEEIPAEEKASVKEPLTPAASEDTLPEEVKPDAHEEKSPFLRRLQGWLRGKRKK